MNILSYILRETVRSLRQEWRMVSVSILSIGITLFFFSIIALTLANVAQWVTLQEDGADIQVYGAMSLTADQEQDLAMSIISREDIASVTVITREEGYELFKELYGTKLLDAVDENPFPVTLDVEPIDDYPAKKLSYLASTLQLLPGVESVTYASQWLDKLHHFKKRATIVGSSILIILFIAIFFSIKNTVQLTVFARRELITNMQYVGASHWRIRAPFLLEGILEGTIGATMALTMLFLLKTTLFHQLPLLWPQNIITTAILSTGAILGLFSGYAAVRPFVK